MFEPLVEAFAVLLVTIGPIDSAAIFAAMTKDADAAYRRKMAVKATLVASGIMLVFALFGDEILRFFGISLSSLQISGGILLLIVSIKIVMSEGEEQQTAVQASGGSLPDISIFPLAMPLFAGPDALVAVVLTTYQAQDDLMMQAGIIVIMLVILVITMVACLTAGSLSRLLGKQGIEVISRLLGVLLTAMAVEFIVEGLHQSALFAS